MRPGISRLPPMSGVVLQQPLSRPTQTCLLSRLRLLGLGEADQTGVAQRMEGSIAVVCLPLLACLLRRSLLRSDQPWRPYPYLLFSLQIHNPGTWIVSTV